MPGIPEFPILPATRYIVAIPVPAPDGLRSPPLPTITQNPC